MGIDVRFWRLSKRAALATTMRRQGQHIASFTGRRASGGFLAVIPLPRSIRRAYTILDLLVVIAIIALLVSILMPALAKAREQARYVRWQAFSRDMSMDENMAVHYNFQNDRGGITIANMAVANHDPSYLPQSMDLLLENSIQNFAPMNNPQVISYFWSGDGRFKGEPAASFTTAVGGRWLVATPMRHEGSGMLARLLRKSQAITVAIWINVPQSQLQQTSSVLSWTDNNHNPLLDIHLPWAGGVYWDTYDPARGWDRVSTPFVYGNDSNWSLWCFTKDNHSHVQKIYLNGEIVAATVDPPSSNSNWQSFCTAALSGSTASINLCFGCSPAANSIDATVDDFAIYDADLSPSDVTSSGTIIPGVPAVRFLQMYQMGRN